MRESSLRSTAVSGSAVLQRGWLVFLLAVAPLAPACGSDAEKGAPDDGAGGSDASAPANGGRSAGSGGRSGGGASGTGGATGSGGSATGGIGGLGGAAGGSAGAGAGGLGLDGGADGSTASGGDTGAGGASGTGGATGGGGTQGAGGDPGAGGTPGTGGNPGAGGRALDASADGGAGGTDDAGPGVKEGGAVPTDVFFSCRSTTVAVGSKGLVATGPTTAFQNAYNSAIGSTAVGPFVLRLTPDPDSNDIASAGFVAGVAPTLSGGVAQPTEGFVEFPYERTAGGDVTLLPFFAAFHIALGGSSVEIAGLDMSGQIDGTCRFIPGATVTLYVAQTQSGVSFAGSTFGALLGAPNADIPGGTNNGWAIPLSGDASQVTLP